MNDPDATPDGAGPNPAARRMAALAARVDEALSRAESHKSHEADDARRQMAEYVADPASYSQAILLTSLTSAVGRQVALDTLGMKPPRPGLVYCCESMGWVTPAEWYDHVSELWSFLNDD